MKYYCIKEGRPGKFFGSLKLFGKVKLLINVQNISSGYLKSFLYLNYLKKIFPLTEYFDGTLLVPYVPITKWTII